GAGPADQVPSSSKALPSAGARLDREALVGADRLVVVAPAVMQVTGDGDEVAIAEATRLGSHRQRSLDNLPAVQRGQEARCADLAGAPTYTLGRGQLQPALGTRPDLQEVALVLSPGSRLRIHGGLPIGMVGVVLMQDLWPPWPRELVADEFPQPLLTGPDDDQFLAFHPGPDLLTLMAGRSRVV